MALPTQAERMDAEADRLVQQTYTADPPTPATPSVETPSDPSRTPAQSPAPAPGQAPAQAPAQASPAPQQDDAAKWQARYSTLQGMFDAENKRHAARAKELEDQVASFKEQVEQASRKPKTAPSPAAPSVTDKDIDAFGGDLIDLMKRQASDIVAAAQQEWKETLAAKDEVIARLQAQLGGVAEQTATQSKNTYIQDLAKVVPDWQTVNAAQGFLDWLAAADPLTGMVRQTYLDDAYGKLDVSRTAALFNAYKATTAPAPATQQQPVTQQPATTTAQELQRQVQPTASQAAPAAAQADPTRVWTAAEVDQFYGDQTKGLYRGRPEDAARITADIDLAISQGRVRP